MAAVGTVNVFERDPALLASCSPLDAEALRPRGRVPGAVYRAGDLNLDNLPRDGLGVLVIAGFLYRRVTLLGRSSTELIGPGDLMRPWEGDRAQASIPASARYRAITGVMLAVLDREFLAATAPWPLVYEALLSRLSQRCSWLTVQSLLAQFPRTEDRLLVLLWHIADRWGYVESDGTTVCPVRMTQETLGGMVASRRPTVSLAMTRLIARGRVSKHQRGWALHGPPPSSAQLEGEALADAFRVSQG